MSGRVLGFSVDANLALGFNVWAGSSKGDILKRILAILATLFLVVSNVQQASAADLYTSDFDSYTIGTPSNFDIDYITYSEFADNPDLHFFGVFTKGVITANQFNDGLDSWAKVSIDADLDGRMDYKMETRDHDLVGNYASPAIISSINGDTVTVLTGCSPQFYGDINNGAKFFAFTLPWDCLKLPTTFGFRVYMEYWDSAEAFFDYMPDATVLEVSHTFNNQPQVSVSKDPPKATSAANGVVSTPSRAPEALEQLSPEVLKSVVTIICAGALGSGWSAKVELAAAHQNAGYKSFIVTNHHVVENCIGSGLVTLELPDGSSHGGAVISWDETNDLAGIVTTASIPGLTWRGQTPSQGWWVGVLGSPRGISGYLTTGLISIILPQTGELGVTSPVNPGNSGGPVFDREGRVLATVSWKLLASEGLAFAKNSPLLCLNIIVCPSRAWDANPSGNSSASSVEERSGQNGEAPVATFEVNQRTLASFSSTATTLTSLQKSQVKAAVEANPNATKFICTGIRYVSQPMSENIKVRKRAKAACEYAKELNPELSTWFQNKPTEARSYAGKVLLTIKSPAS